MNTLSWLIYCGEVVGRLGVMVGVGLTFSIIGIAVTCGIRAGMTSDGTLPEGSWADPLRYLWVPVILATIALFAPSKTTIYLIAASEAGEAVVTSPDAIEMMGDLKAIIKKRLKEELGE